jgi:hypothetical protein
VSNPAVTPSGRYVVTESGIWDWGEYFFYERYPRMGAYGVTHNGEWFSGVPYDNKHPRPPLRFEKPMFQMWCNIFFVGRSYCRKLTPSDSS